jgi:hypothetical protein
VSYSSKVQDIFAPRGQSPSLSDRFVLLEPPPLEVSLAGRLFRFQIETDSVSKELRLFAVDLQCEKAGSYSAYLLATSGKKADFDRRMFVEGILSESRPGNGMFRQLVRDGRARSL